MMSFAIMISLMSASLAHASVIKLEDIKKQGQAALAKLEPYRAAILAEAPGLLSPLLGDQEGTGLPACTADRPASTYALLIAPDDFGFGQAMISPANDVELITEMLQKLGVKSGNIHAAVGSRASRANIKSAMDNVLSALGCNDRAVLHYSGITQGLDPAFDAAVRLHSTSTGKTGLLEVSVLRAKLDRLVEDADPAFYNLMAGNTADIAFWLNHEQTDVSEFILASDISDFVVLARNRGAHVTVVIDANDAQSLALAERQTAAGDESSWTFAYGERPNDGQLRLLPGHGQYAAFYASATGKGTPEGRFPEGDSNAKSYGLFTFTIVSALGRSAATPRAIASALNDAYDAHRAGKSTGSPRIEASNPDFALLGEVQEPQHDAIRIIAPESVRGAAALDRQEITVEGVVDWPAPILGVIVGDKPAAVESGGRFKQTLQLKEGLNVLNVIAVTADSRMHQKRVELVFKGDRQALEGKGRRYAVIIANQTYGGATGMTNLATPFADADALATILTEKYGFELELGIGGAIQPLMLKDPTKRQIEVALHQLGKVAGLNDTVLVFYAGHGVFEPITSNAYWVPADAELGFEPSYLSAADISAAIQRIQANHVILISDSCYSGALLRGGNAENAAIAEDQRMQALLKMQSRKSRIVITSGNNEPVADLGGDGHSVFARALLTGLEKMDHEAFSARELFDGYIIQQVTANADQEPQYRPLEKVGHEGGDFIFVKSSAASAQAAD